MSGSSTGRGRGCHGRGRGKGGRAACLLSPEEEDCSCKKYFEFVVFINDDPFGKKKLPDTFAKFLIGREPASVTLRATFAGGRWRSCSMGKA
jgi:hypothetical protein